MTAAASLLQRGDFGKLLELVNPVTYALPPGIDSNGSASVDATSAEICRVGECRAVGIQLCHECV